MRQRKIFLIAVSFCMAEYSYGQTVPADLLDLSIEELFAVNVDATTDGSMEKKSRWSFSYNFQKSSFNDYYDGDSKISNQDVLWQPDEERRSSKNYPVVPTKIDQEVHALRVGYNLTDVLSLSVVAPYIRQSTDHISIVQGYDEFKIKSDGLGDISIIGSYQFSGADWGNWRVGLGISVPTGSIDEEGDTPRDPGDQQLPYTMQLGSGTYDIPAFISFGKKEVIYDWGVDLRGKLRLGENDRDYTLGNNLSVSGWTRLTNFEWLQPSVHLSYWYSEKISGMDSDLKVPGPYPYPAPVVDPDRFGGHQVDLKFGIRIPIVKRIQYVEFLYSVPLYRNLNGPQSGEEYTVGFSFNTAW
jgi:hypothetical protein